MKYYFLSETAFSIDLSNEVKKNENAIVQILDYFKAHPNTSIVDVVPAATTICIFYDITTLAQNPIEFAEVIVNQIENIPFTNNSITQTVVKMPICMDACLALDLASICEAKNISIEEFKKLFFQKTYTVSHLGFLPGFPYISGLDGSLHLPRKASPRTQVLAGAVAIANDNIGIYPLSSPGGWNIIGATYLHLYDADKEQPFLLEAGTSVQFEEIDFTTFEKNKRGLKNNLDLPKLDDPSIIITKSIGINTIQATPRIGKQSFGVPLSGAMVPSLVNQLHQVLENDTGFPVIEMAMSMLHVTIKKPCVVAFAGAINLKINDTEQMAFNAINLNIGDAVKAEFNNQAMYGYLAFNGVMDLPLVLGSYSTSVNARLGYMIKNNDTITLTHKVSRTINKPVPAITKKGKIRCFAGPEYYLLVDTAKRSLENESFAIDLQANRMAVKLNGPKITLKLEMISTAVTSGTVQLTPAGQLIVLMNDAQTTGGYPRVLQIAEVDMEQLALHKPNESITFELISFEEAVILLKNRNNAD